MIVMIRKFAALSALLTAMVTVAGCGGSEADSASDRAAARSAGEAAIRALVEQTVEAAGRKDMDTYLKFYAHDAILVLPGMPITEHSTLPDNRDFPKGYAIKMDTAKVGISEFGDMGYAFGTYEQTAPDRYDDDMPLVDTTGKWMAVFRKQPDGTWGAIADTFNVDPEPQ